RFLDPEGGSYGRISLPYPEQDAARRLCLLHPAQHRPVGDTRCDPAAVVRLHATGQRRNAQAGLEAAVETVPELRQGHAGAALWYDQRRRVGVFEAVAARGQARMRLNNRTAVVTGAGSGIGRAIAQSLAQRGCHLALADISEAGLAETA